jgi:DNA invertase Pin-like site-specific DNA recombinase
MMACYCRVSTRRQKVDSQKADIQRWLMGQAVPSTTIQWFEDVDSGTTLARPAFDRMQQGIFLGTITTVVVWKLDRISRRQREGINLLAEWCDRGGARRGDHAAARPQWRGGAPRGRGPLWLSRD